MIETDEQRRWWFATHPEYSWSRKGDGPPKPRQKEEASEKVRPEDVDAYVDNALKYADQDVAYLLKSVKKHCGTEGASQSPVGGAETQGWDTEAGGRAGPPQGVRQGPRHGRGSRRGLEFRDWHHRSREERHARDLIEDELEQAGANRYDYQLTSFAGQRTAQRDGLYDPYQIDHLGRTNVQRMREGEAPLDRNGDFIVLHHSGQRQEGPLIEMTQREHRSIRVRREPSKIDRPGFGSFRRDYWRARAASIGRPAPRRFSIE